MALPPPPNLDTLQRKQARVVRLLSIEVDLAPDADQHESLVAALDDAIDVRNAIERMMARYGPNTLV